jgi:hypothetical protein
MKRQSFARKLILKIRHLVRSNTYIHDPEVDQSQAFLNERVYIFPAVGMDLDELNLEQHNVQDIAKLD